MALKIFCPVWGPKHQKLLNDALLRSLSWERNRPYIETAEWLIITDSAGELARATTNIQEHFPMSSIRHFIHPELADPNIDRGMVIIKSVQKVVDICLKESTPMLMATPDFIYGNGTIETFAKIADEPGSCATIANIRVLPSILPVKHEDLVEEAFMHLHPSWAQSPLNLYRSGVKIAPIGVSTWAVRHFMPSPFYVNFIEEDKNYFKEWHEGKPPGFGLWDHVWPTHLLEDGRLRFIGSSDAAVMCEVTDEDSNVPPLNAAGDPPNKFFRDHFHNKIQSQFVTIFRGS